MGMSFTIDGVVIACLVPQADSTEIVRLVIAPYSTSLSLTLSSQTGEVDLHKSLWLPRQFQLEVQTDTSSMISEFSSSYSELTNFADDPPFRLKASSGIDIALELANKGTTELSGIVKADGSELWSLATVRYYDDKPSHRSQLLELSVQKKFHVSVA